MISAKKLVSMARKWQRIAAIRRKKITFPRTKENVNAHSGSNISPVADIGHFVIYTSDHKRFVVPLAYLNNIIFRELFKISEEEFGLPSDGPIILPCDAVFMEYVVSLIRRGVAKDVENALLNHITTSCCSLSTSLHQCHTSRKLLVCSY